MGTDIVRGSSHDDQYGDGDGVGDDHHDVEEVESISTATAWELISCGAGHTARATSQPRSPHLGFLTSAWNQVPIPVFLVFSQISILSTAFVYRGRAIVQAHSASPETVTWGFHTSFPVYYPISIHVAHKYQIFHRGTAFGQSHTNIEVTMNIQLRGIWILRSLSSVGWK